MQPESLRGCLHEAMTFLWSYAIWGPETNTGSVSYEKPVSDKKNLHHNFGRKAKEEKRDQC